MRLIFTAIILSSVLVCKAQCYKDFKYTLGTSGADGAYDIVNAANDEFFVIGTTTVEGTNSKNVIVTKMNAGGAILWTKTYGGTGTETVRKASRTADNGLLITGSTSSFSNAKGDIMCLKLNNNGTVGWLRKFGLGSVDGDLGMDIIETSDGGYAITGAVNAGGSTANMVVIRLNKDAVIMWSKIFDGGLMETGTGITESGNSLIVTADIQRAGYDADGIIVELDKANGTMISQKKLHPVAGGLSRPYIYRDSVNGGYWINGHLTDKNSPSKMEQIILRLDSAFYITKSYKLVLPEYANNNFSGFQYLDNGGFIACSGMESMSTGFIYSIREDGNIAFAKMLFGGTDRKLTRLSLIGNKIIAVGSDNREGDDEMFIIGFDSSGEMGPTCQTGLADLSVQSHSFITGLYNWVTIKDAGFTNVKAVFTPSIKTLKQTILCSDECEKPVINVEFEAPDTVCVNTPATIINKTTGGKSFSWYTIINGTADVYTSSDSMPPPITYSFPGSYNIDLTVDKGLPTETYLSKSITVVAPRTPLLLPDTSFCAGDSLLLNTGANYLWINGATDSFIVIKQPGDYEIEINYYGCILRDNIYVIQNTLPIVSLGNDTAVCANNPSLILNAGNPGAAYLWQDGSAAQTFHVTGTGTYTVQVKDVNGCISNDSVQINMHEKMQWELAGERTICAGSTTQLQAIGANIQKFSWSPAVTLSDSTIHNPFAAPTDTTLYTLTVTDINGCKDKDSVWVNVKPSPFVITNENSTVCAGSKIALSTLATPGVSYSWSPADYLSNISGGGAVATPETSVKYTVTVASSNGCTAADSVSIHVNPAPAVVAATMDTLICPGSSAHLAAASPTAVSYTWSPALSLTNASNANTIATPATTTQYYVEAVNAYGCTAKDSVLVTVKTKGAYAIDPPFATVCLGKSVVLTAKGGDVYHWYPSNTLSVADDAIVTATPATNTQYKVVITDTGCGITDSVFATVNISSSHSSITVSKSNDIDCLLSTTMLKAAGGVSYRWFPANSLSAATIANPVATPSQTTTYYVEITNGGGCTTVDSITVYVFKGSVENGYKLPSAFTPNNDGNNDCFGVRTWGALMSLDLSIYNRQGKLIFHSNNSSNCWDGTYNGNAQPTGSYIYQVKARNSCGVINRSGSILLIR